MLYVLLSATRLAFGAVRRNKLRASLTVLGILIGVAAVVLVSAMGTGARDNINKKVESLGSNMIIIFSAPNQRSGARKAVGAGLGLTEDDAAALAREASSISAAAPVARLSSQLVYESRNYSTQVYGTTLDFFRIRTWGVGRGALWDVAAREDKQSVIVLGATPARELFGPLDPVGRTIRIGRQPFRVIAVLEEKGQSPFGGQDQDDLAVVPLPAYQSRIGGAGAYRGVGQIQLSASSSQTVKQAVAQAESILRQRHRIAEAEDPDFVVRTQEELQKSQDSIYGALSTLLLSVGVVSLFVGGIGIMNIMLVSVAERTREIGVRMAIGAKEGDILVQFLVESVILGLLGGVGGAALGVLLIGVLRSVLEWPMQVQATPLAIAVATSMLIGVVFGFFPARRAARMDPIQALGRE